MTDLRTHFGGLGNRLFQLSYVYAQARKGEIPDIYVQDPRYFEPYQQEIRTLFADNLAPLYMVSLHVRRGDYINNPYYVDLTQTDYYERAIEQFPDAKFLVFCADRQTGSDDKADMEWCRRRFPGNRFTFYQGKDEIDDFNAMSSCTQGHIIANSSFSWFSAFVGGGKTVYPAKWFTGNKEGIPPLTDWISV